MAITNHERVSKAVDLLRTGLAPYIEREFQAYFKAQAQSEAHKFLGDDRMLEGKSIVVWDAAALLKLMWESWNEVFRRTLGPAERTLVSELRDVRNRWAHQQPFSTSDAYRALDSGHRLLLAVSASQADELDKMKMELLRVQFDEQRRSEQKKSQGSAIEGPATGTLKPWREVVTPHKDVASGRYQQAEFAADLWQVHLGEGSAEYRDPAEFFRRTFLTESLKRLLVSAVQRLSGKAGDPVVQLQTNFGGGKTHSMLALYHLFSGASAKDLVGVDIVLKEAGATNIGKAKRVVLVGNKISPGNPVTKSDGTVIRTLWGELAWQLGGKKAFARIAADDEKATSPGDVLRELFKEYGPCLVLIDEWVAYARQLHDQSDLPAGSFETQFSFAQALTESAKLAGNCLLVISLPASDTAASPHTQAEDVEVGGVRGREALDRLRNVIGRVESSWRPASAEEGFEIVRRRLFEPLLSAEQFKQRDVIAREFFDQYRAQKALFPPDCAESEYEKRLTAAYPIHPEIFDRLYTDWSTLVKFQRTRGVLRLMAAVIHSLWEKGDRNPLIMPSMIPIDDPRVQFELTRYLPDAWTPIIEKDIDGPNSLPLRIDGEVPNLGKLHACRRVARTVYLGSAPLTSAAHRGIEDRRIHLGCAMPGESPNVFGDALRRLAGAATYLYQDGPRYWYSTQPTVTKLAEDRAEQLSRNEDAIADEIERRVRADLRNKGDFARVHDMAKAGADVPDDMDARLVVLSPDAPYSKEVGNAAETAAKSMLESRGNSPRLFRNALAFLAADKVRLQDLDVAVRKYLAWKSIVDEADTLNLDRHQKTQAETQLKAADSVAASRVPETYYWLLVPEQKGPQGVIEWNAIRLSGSDPLAVRASKKMKSDDLLIALLGPSILRKHLDDVPLWRGDNVAIRQLVDDFARYLYLPRLTSPSVLTESIRAGVASLAWVQDSFAYADRYDEAAGRYRGLRTGQNISLDESSPGLIVKPDVAARQLDQDSNGTSTSGNYASPQPASLSIQGHAPNVVATTISRRFYGSVVLDSTRVGRDAGRIAEEVVAHLAALPGAEVRVTLEIAASIPNGAPENVVRTVTENARTLRFGSQGFEKE